jgi:hypothetical protein
MEPHWESLYDTCVSPALSYLDMQRPPQRSTDFRVEYALVCFYEHAPYGNRLLKTNNFTPKLTARSQPTRAPASAAATPAAPAHAAQTPMHAPDIPPRLRAPRRSAAPGFRRVVARRVVRGRRLRPERGVRGRGCRQPPAPTSSSANRAHAPPAVPDARQRRAVPRPPHASLMLLLLSSPRSCLLSPLRDPPPRRPARPSPFVRASPEPPPPPSPRTNWTRLVPPSVLTGHVSSLLPY